MKFGQLLNLLFVLVLCFSLAHSELHRAKVVASKPSQNGGSRTNLDKVELPRNDTSFLNYLREKIGYKLETWVLSLVSAALVGASGILPLLVIPLEAGKALREDGAKGAALNVVLSFAVGSLLGDVFLHLLPEAWQHISPGDHLGHMKIGIWALFGILSFLIIEKVFGEPEEKHIHDKETHRLANSNNNKSFEPKIKSDITQLNGVSKDLNIRKRKSLREDSDSVPNEKISNGAASHSESEEEEEEHMSKHQQANVIFGSGEIHVSGYLNLFANVIDNFTHGLAVAGSYIAGTKVGLLTTFAILVHEIPHEVGDFAILLRSGFDRWKAAKAQVLTASGGLLGALVALCSESAESAGDSVAWILPFTSGGFLYIALVTVVPDLLKETKARESAKQLIALCTGVGVMILVTYLA